MARRILVPAALLASSLVTVPTVPAALADEAAAGRPSAVTALSGEAAGEALTITGSAAFGGQRPVDVSDDAADDANLVPRIGDTYQQDLAGVDLLGAALSVPDPAVSELLVQWQVAGLPPTGGIPEGTRLTLPFKVGGVVYQVQAKATNIVSPDTAGDPQGAVTHAAAAFELGGSCSASYNGTGFARCSRLAWLTGSLDAARGIVSARVPLASAVAPQIVAGALLRRNDSTSADLNDILAGYQAGVASAGQVDDRASFGPPEEQAFAFRIPEGEVRLGVAAEGTNPSLVDLSTLATVAADGSFTGTVSTSGFAPGSFDVYAQACFADNCGVRSLGGIVAGGDIDGAVAVLEITEDEDDSYVFWRGGRVGDGIIYSWPTQFGNNATLQACTTAPCFTYTLKVGSAGAARLRVAIDVPARNDNFYFEVRTPTAAVSSALNGNNFNKEIWINNPAVGTYSILVRPYSAANAPFLLRAKLEAQLPSPHVEPDGSVLPDLRPSAPYDFGFAAPANGTGSGGDDQNPPLEVGGLHPFSCSIRSETMEEGVTRCLRFSFGLVNAGRGNFDIRWTGDSATQPRGENIQCVQQAVGTPLARPSGISEWHEAHGHWHYLDLIYLELFSVTDPDTGAMLLRGAGKKLGYQPADQALAHWWEFDAGQQSSSGTFGNCAPETSNRLGMAPGWGDVYRYQRAGNFVPFEGNADGLYVLRLTIDHPSGTSDILESDEGNNASYAYLRVTGDEVQILEQGRGQSPWDPEKEVLRARLRGGVPW